jgi:hypothetical protein
MGNHTTLRAWAQLTRCASRHKSHKHSHSNITLTDPLKSSCATQLFSQHSHLTTLSSHKMSTSGKIYCANEVDLNLVEYAAPRQMDSGARSLFINYKGGPLLIQTPQMEAPFGFGGWCSNGERTVINADKYNLDLSFRGRESRTSVGEFEDFLTAFDQRLIADGFANCQLWLKKNYPSADVVEALYTKMRKESKDPSRYAATFKMNLPYRDGKFQFPSYDGARNEIPNLMDIVTSDSRGKGCMVKAILQCGGVWLAGGKFGVTWRVRQLQVVEAQRLTGFAFKPTDDDEDFTLDDEPATTSNKSVVPSSGSGSAAAATTHAGSHLLQSSSDDEEFA